MPAPEESRAGASHGNLASMFKYFSIEQIKRKYEILLEMMDTQALGCPSLPSTQTAHGQV